MQVDPSGSGRVAAADAALFLKRCGLSDLVLGKIWDLADSERKGFLNKQQFFVALRLVACAQNGLEVAFKSLNVAVPPPNFQDTSSPLLPGAVPVDSPWVVKPEEKLKFDAIFDSLSPVGGMLTGDKVKPVLLNSKLPVDVLGRVWELSDIDRDGMLDKDEFAVAMYLVYRALENEPVPVALPPSLVPPSKRKKVTPTPVMPLLPSPPPSLKERGSWVVSSADKAKYDELFIKTDSDMDGLVSGPEVRDIFLKTGLPSATLARIWELCDIGDIGKLTREQFALALYLINQKLSKGIDPPQTLSPEMIPPSDRLPAGGWLAVPSIAAVIKYSCLCWSFREKSSVEQEIKEKEESIRERTSEVQDLQDEVQKESEELRRLQTERQEVQEALERLDEQKSSLEEQLKLIRQQCSQENQLIQSLQVEHSEQEQRIGDYEDELVRAREELLRLQEETRSLGEKVRSARAQLCPLQDAVTESHTQIAQAPQAFISSLNCLYKPLFKLAFLLGDVQVESPAAEQKEEPSQPVLARPGSPSSDDFFQSDPFTDSDPFKDDDPFSKVDISDPFGGDPFKGTDPFATDTFFKQSSSANFPTGDPFASSDPFNSNTGSADPDLFSSQLNNTTGSDPFSSRAGTAVTADPFSSSGNAPFVSKKDTDSDPFSSASGAGDDPFGGSDLPAVSKNKFNLKRDSLITLSSNDPFAPGGTAVNADSDPDPFATVFGNESFGGGFADFSSLAKSNGTDPFASSNTNSKNLFKEDNQTDVPPALPPKTGTPTRPPPPPPGYEREERERVARLTQQEQEDLELAIALSKSELS
uniref:Epidermal growth factor receptor pathway substrate 15 n=1 Tax=Pygocentrus nattereri TaxID=42514 RepID=A0AAR2KG24_PYGNA